MSVKDYGFVQETDPYPVGSGGQLLLNNDKALSDVLKLYTLASVNVKHFGAAGDGTTDDSAAFLAADTEAQSSNKFLAITEGTYLIDDDITIDSNLIILGGLIKVGSGKTLTINGNLIAPITKIFDYTPVNPVGAYATTDGKIKFSKDSPTKTIYPDWWGEDTTSSDWQVPIQAAIESVSYNYLENGSEYFNIGIVKFLPKIYNMRGPIFVGYDFDTYTNTKYAIFDESNSPGKRKQMVILDFNGACLYTASFKYSNSEDLYFIYYAPLSVLRTLKYIKDLYLECGWLCRGILVNGMAYGNCMEQVTIRDPIKVGLDTIDCWGGTFRNINVNLAKGIAIRNDSANSCRFESISLSSYGYNNDFFPDPEEEIIKDGGYIIQTPINKRGTLIASGGDTDYVNIIFESNNYGVPIQSRYEDNGSGKIKLRSMYGHTFQVGDPIYIEYDRDYRGYHKSASGTVTNVGTSTVELDIDYEEPTYSNYAIIWKRVTSITKGNPTIVQCSNHGLVVGQEIKFHANSGMTEIDKLRGEVTEVVDTNTFKVDIDSTGFSDSDGSEYFDWGYPGFVTNGTSRLLHPRWEGNSFPDCRVKIIRDNYNLATVVDGGTDAGSHYPSASFAQIKVEGATSESYAYCHVFKNLVRFFLTECFLDLRGTKPTSLFTGLILENCNIITTWTNGTLSVEDFEKYIKWNGVGESKYHYINGQWTDLMELEDVEEPTITMYAVQTTKRSLLLGQYKTSVTHTTDITGFDVGKTGYLDGDIFEGTRIYVYFPSGNARTLVHNDAGATYPLILKPASDKTPDDEIISFMFVSNKWYEL